MHRYSHLGAQLTLHSVCYTRIHSHMCFHIDVHRHLHAKAPPCADPLTWRIAEDIKGWRIADCLVGRGEHAGRIDVAEQYWQQRGAWRSMW